VLAAAIVGGWAINQRNEAQDEADLANQQVAELTEVLTAPDVEAAAAVVAGGGTASVVRSASQETALLVAADLPSLPSDKVYEAWTFRGNNNPVPAGTFETQGAQTTFALTPAALKTGLVALTVEPAGGSEQPTTSPIVAIELPT
jgi:anti-sigma-K factor RskA